jgi:hypothetical protein
MKKYILSISAVGILFTTLITSCDKEKADLAPTETYKLIGQIDASRSNIPTAVLTKAEFTVVYNNGNSFGDAQSVLNGTLTLTGFVAPIDTITTKVAIANSNPADSNVTRIFNANSLEFLGARAGTTDISFFNIPTSKTITYRTSATSIPASGIFGNYATNNYYVYNNSSSASFNVTNMPFTNEITEVIKNGKGYFRLGRAPKFVYILLDNVTKL